ncbi:MAG: sporulation protein YunB [Clostridiales bacterium]|nr:sporulation protein YunB [Candidatus Cacconaster stercorequi]
MGRLRYVRLSLRQRMMIWGLVLFSALAALCAVAVIHMKPIITSMATARVSNTVNRIVAAAVNDAVDRGEINYGAMIRFEKDEQGRVTALYSNMAEFNRLQTTISDEILQRLSEVSTSELSIPVGSLTGSSLLAGRGPSIRIRMQAVGSTQCSFRNAFMSAGINQTKHQVLLDVNVYMSILLPGFTASTEVKNEIAVAETVIVGSVPENYTNFSTVPDETEQYAEDYIMNNG